jgi:hypothetical protein
MPAEKTEEQREDVPDSGGTVPVGDAVIDLPPGASATQGAAQGSGLSGSVPDPHGLADADPGGDTALTGDGVPAQSTAAGSPAESGLGLGPAPLV